jgi:hypothetical protein
LIWFQYQQDNIDQAWQHCESMIADALARSNGYALAKHIKEWIKEDKMQLWFLWDSEMMFKTECMVL